MAYVIKRYANRKLYDTQSKRYLTLDEVSILVRAGEQVQVIDADSGDDLTGQVLSKIIAEGSRREGGLVPQNLLVEWIQRPGEAVVGAVRSSVSAGKQTVEQFGGELARLLGNLVGRDGRHAVESTRQAAEGMARVIEDRLRTTIAEFDFARRADLKALEARVAALEEAARSAAARSSATEPAAPSASAAPKRTATARTRKTASTRKAKTTGGEGDG